MDLVIFAGPNGSGKSSIADNFYKLYFLDSEYVNPDIYVKEIKSDISEKEKYLRAFKISENKCKELMENQSDFCIETVNSTDRKFELYKQCKKIGYRITVIFVGTESYDINVKRVAKRITQGGHNVPTEKVISRYNKSMQNLIKLVGFADVVYIFDNSIDDKSPKLIFYKDEKDLKILEKKEWLKKYLLEPLSKI